MTCNNASNDPVTAEEILELIRNNDGIKFENVLLRITQKRFNARLNRASLDFLEENNGLTRRTLWELAHKGQIIIGPGYDLHLTNPEGS